MTEDYDYFRNKRQDRVYLSKTLGQRQFIPDGEGGVRELTRPFRIASKIVEATECHHFIKKGNELVLHITDGQRQEVIAKFYEDTRGIFTLTIQKYTKQSGVPHRTSFSFVGNQIGTLRNFLNNIEVLPLKDPTSQKLDDRFVDELVLTREQLARVIQDQPELVAELARTQVKAGDLAELGYRRAQLEEFEKLLTDADHFEAARAALGQNKRAEDVWQAFFERNNWIFGYGLNYFFNTSLEGKRLEQVVKGYDVGGAGKEADALLKTRGIVSALAFGEIKTHSTPLLKQVQKPYRSECWQVSDELSGGIAQVQKTVQIALENLKPKLEPKTPTGDPTGETVFLYQPRAFLVIGSLSEFRTAHGINSDKYSSFELFRRSVSNPEIIAFDELFERAKHIVASGGRPD